MALPEPFSDIEHLQLTIRRYLNKQIREDFRDMFDDGDTWEPEVGTTRGAMLRALLHEDSDPIAVTSARMMLYYFTFGKARNLQTPIYGIPATHFQESIKFYPQVRLFFNEDYSLVEDGYESVKADISFRLMNETEETITPAKAQIIATRIRSLFATGQGFTWKKGREKWCYYDQSRGYKLQILAWNESEAKKVIEQVLDVQQHTPNWQEYLSVATKKRSFPTVPGTHRVYGKQRRKPRDRPVAFVRFRYAELKVWGMTHAVTLVDKTGTRRNPLIAA